MTSDFRTICLMSSLIPLQLLKNGRESFCMKNKNFHLWCWFSALTWGRGRTFLEVFSPVSAKSCLHEINVREDLVLLIFCWNAFLPR